MAAIAFFEGWVPKSLLQTKKSESHMWKVESLLIDEITITFRLQCVFVYSRVPNNRKVTTIYFGIFSNIFIK